MFYFHLGGVMILTLTANIELIPLSKGIMQNKSKKFLLQTFLNKPYKIRDKYCLISQKPIFSQKMLM